MEEGKTDNPEKKDGFWSKHGPAIWPVLTAVGIAVIKALADALGPKGGDGKKE